MKIDFINKLIRCVVIGIIFIALFTLEGIKDMRQAHQIVFMLAMISLFSFILDNIWVTLFLLWTVFLFCFFKFDSGKMYLSNIFFGCVLYYITKISFKKEHIDFFINGFLWFVVANIFYMAIQAIGYDFIYKGITYFEGFEKLVENKNIQGFMGHKSIMASLMAFAVPLLATRKSTISMIGAFGLFIPLYISHTALCLFVGFVGILFVLYYKISKRLFITLVCIFLLFSSFYYKKVDNLGTERFPVWCKVMSNFVVHPVTGWGLDSFGNFTKNKNFRYSNGVQNYSYHKEPDGKEYKDITFIEFWDNPHNLYISLLFEFGFIGLFLFVGYIRQNVMKYKNAIKDPNTIALAGFILVFLLISMGHFPIFLAREACFIIPSFALFEVSTA